MGLELQIDKVAKLIVESQKIVVFTGAGISTESGIPDFRSPGGIWSKFDPEDFTIQKFVSDPEARRKQWQFLVQNDLLTAAVPNDGHRAIAELETMRKLDAVVTQNIDNLHQKAGNSPEKVFELHGNMSWILCMECHGRYPMEEIRKRIERGEEIPECENCGGMLKPDVVLFGEALPQDVVAAAVEHAKTCDLLIVIGSSLVVYPAAYIPAYASEAGAKLVIINMTGTSYDVVSNVVIYNRAGEVMKKIVERVKERINH
ncbi:MAG: NAD-dependent protein deacylase [Deltaproteobacteria bacterium]|nr:NAD-dependent protein deacylase [Deltaproteobacteria bacterium]